MKEIAYDESRIPPYVLPDPHVCADGTLVRDAETWRRKRRPELLRLFADEVYGRMNGPLAATRFAVVEEGPDALDGKATRRQVAVLFDGTESGPRMDLLLYLPKDRPRPLPVFLSYNGGGNHVIHSDPAIRLPVSWVPARDGLTNGNRAAESGRGAHRWPVDRILHRGYVVATASYHDLDPDFSDGFRNGIHPLFQPTGWTDRAPYEWGAIGAWAWGLSRAMDWFAQDSDIDATRVAVMGHSRLGKTALWAGATDERFAIVIANNSGKGGASLARRTFGESIEHLNGAFPHWFCPNYARYIDDEAALPVDQHELIALVAPRPVYVASATEDLWADPRGEFLAARAADPVYRLLGTDGLAATEMPAPGRPIMSTIGYHLRPGKHDVTEYDWARYLDFADHHFARSSAFQECGR